MLAVISEIVSRLERLDERISELKDLLLTQAAVKEHYTTEEVARITGKADFTVREWCRRGRIRAIKKWSGRGKHQGWAIPHEELLRYQREGLRPDRRG
jgi:hypothetical protein